MRGRRKRGRKRKFRNGFARWQILFRFLLLFLFFSFLCLFYVVSLLACYVVPWLDLDCAKEEPDNVAEEVNPGGKEESDPPTAPSLLLKSRKEK